MTGNHRFSRQNFIRGARYLKRNGIKYTFYKVGERLFRDADEKDYDAWFAAHRPTERELSEQRRDGSVQPGKISILVPAFETPEPFFAAMVRSVFNQSYENWELCIADGSASDRVKEMTRDLLIREAGALERDLKEKLRYVKLGENRGIAENTNAALALATGDYVCLLDHDDLLREDALYEAAKVLSSGAEAVYTDEDKIDGAGRRHFDCHRKPDFNKDLLLSNNYICHLFVVRRETAGRTGGFRGGYDGAQDYDFILRCTHEILSRGGKIAHVAKPLYHWRSHEASTAENPDSKMYAYEAGKKALSDYLEGCGIRAQVSHTRHLGFYRVRYGAEPAQEDGGDVLISVTDALKPLDPGWEAEMRGYFARPEVGVVGGKIYDRRNRILCAGYERDPEGRVVSSFAGMRGGYSGYLHRAVLQRDVEAVDLSCMMVRKSVFHQVGGTLPETGRTDVEASYEFCRRVREAGYLVVFDPYAGFQMT